MAGRKWTTDEERILCTAVEASGVHGYFGASDQIGRTPEACRIYYQEGVKAGRWPPAETERKRWTDEENATIARLAAEGRSIHEITDALPGRGHKGVQTQLSRLRVSGAIPPAAVVKVSPDYTPASEDSVEAVWDRAEAQTARDVEKHSKRRFATVDFPDDGLPVGIFFTPDQHIRLSGPIQMTRMREDAELTRDTPGLYALLMGDGIDNHIVISQAMVRGGTKPSEEWRLFDHYLRMFGEPGASKILAVVSGNHDAWTIDKAGVDVLGMLVKNQQLHYSPDEVVLTCKVGPQSYVIKARHRYSRYGSTFNPSHKTKRMLEMGEDDFDIGAIAHDHEPNVEVFWRMGRRRVSIRTGAYQFSSSYAEAHGFTRFPVGCPAVLLFPNEKRFTPYDSVWEAADVLRLYRARKAA